jgi:hypothetical protein
MYSAKQIEAALNYPPESECFGIYVGYQQIQSTRGYTKIGRTINVRALQRGRNQGGADWWFAAFWPLESKAQTHSVESAISKSLKGYKQAGPQGQRELYNISPERAIELVTEILGEPLRIQHEQV